MRTTAILLAAAGLYLAPDVFDDLREYVDAGDAAVTVAVSANAAAIVANGADIAANTAAIAALEDRVAVLEGGTPPPPPPPPPSGGFPADMPLVYQPLSPAAPTGGIVDVSSGDITAVGNTTYNLTGDVGVISLGPSSDGVAILGNGFSADSVVMNSQWGGGNPITDVYIENLHSRGVNAQNAFAVALGGSRIHLKGCSSPATAERYGWWGAGNQGTPLTDIFLEDCQLLSDGTEAACRNVAGERVAIVGGIFGTPSKHAIRFHTGGTGYVGRYYWASDLEIRSPFYLGYQSRPTEGVLEFMTIKRTVMFTTVGAGAWFDHMPNPQLSDLIFEDNTGPGTPLAGSNLSSLQTQAALGNGWSVANNIN